LGLINETKIEKKKVSKPDNSYMQFDEFLLTSPIKEGKGALQNSGDDSFELSDSKKDSCGLLPEITKKESLDNK